MLHTNKTMHGHNGCKWCWSFFCWMLNLKVKHIVSTCMSSNEKRDQVCFERHTNHGTANTSFRRWTMQSCVGCITNRRIKRVPPSLKSLIQSHTAKPCAFKLTIENKFIHIPVKQIQVNLWNSQNNKTTTVWQFTVWQLNSRFFG